MSSTSSRPRVQKISGPILTSVAAAGVVLAARGIQALIGAVKTTRRGGRPESTPQDAGLQSASALREEFLQNRQDNLEQTRVKLPMVEALRAATLASVANTPFYIENVTALKPYCQALQAATTLPELKRAEGALLDTLIKGHQQVFVDTLALACQRAAARVGFDQLEIVRLPSEVRVIASDSSGRSLVSEIQADNRREPSLATEVVGVLDGSCQQILDEFDRALEDEGVRSEPPDRKFTGGVCELAAAREIARNRWKPLAKAAQVKDPEQSASMSRTRRLNATPETKVRTKG